MKEDMMRRSLARILAIPVVSAGVLAGIAIAAPAALASTDTGGTVTLTVPLSVIEQFAKAGVVEFPVPLSEASVDTTTQTATITFPVTGGDGDSRVFFGQVNMGGELKFVSAAGKVVTVSSLDFNLANGYIEGIPSGSTTAIPILDPGGDVVFGTGTTSQFVDASTDTIDPAAATYLNNALHTSAFTAGTNVGSVAATWDFSV
jgi:hypothetical protein